MLVCPAIWGKYEPDTTFFTLTTTTNTRGTTAIGSWKLWSGESRHPSRSTQRQNSSFGTICCCKNSSITGAHSWRRLRYSMPMQHASLMQRLIGNHMHSLRIIEKKTIFLEEQQDGGINNNRMFLWSGVALLPFATHSWSVDPCMACAPVLYIQYTVCCDIVSVCHHGLACVRPTKCDIHAVCIALPLCTTNKIQDKNVVHHLCLPNSWKAKYTRFCAGHWSCYTSPAIHIHMHTHTHTPPSVRTHLSIYIYSIYT